MALSPHTLTVNEELKTLLKSMDLLGVPEAWFSSVAADSAAHLAGDSAGDTAGESPTEALERGTETATSGFDWDELEKAALSCQSCGLCEQRKNVVFGAGKRDGPKIVFVGEGPGSEEDTQGEPFVGEAGKLFTAALTKGMGLRREDVYLCNLVKCHPPKNRSPLPEEVAACFPYLERQLELLKPEVIVTLGAPAQLALSGVTLGITKLRGTWQEWRGIPLMPTLHPAYLLRNTAAKKDFWEDLQAVMQKVGIKHA